MSHPEASAGGPARPGKTAPAGGPACLPAGRPADPERGQPHAHVWRPRARAGRPRRPVAEADASGGIWPGAGTPRALPPAPPRSAGRPVRRQEGEGRARAGDAGGRPPGPARPPLGQGTGGPRTPPGTLRLLGFPIPTSPDTVPARRGAAPPAVNGEEAGTEEAGRRTWDTRPPPPTPLLPARGPAGGGGGRRMDGWTDGVRPAGPTARPRTRTNPCVEG